MPIKEHLTNSLKIQTGPSPWPRMFLSSFSITIPLIIGLSKNQLAVSMFGSLFSLVLILNDHFGPLKKRIIHIFTTFLFLCASLVLGNFLNGQQTLLLFCLFIFSFLLGKTKDMGNELERMVLFSVLYMMTIADSPTIKDQIAGPVLYSFFSFLIYIITLSIIYLFEKNSPQFIKSKRDTFKKAFQRNESNYFSLIYAITSVFSFLFSKYIKIEKAYWVTGTVLIVMLPDAYPSYYKSFQRFIGTVLGVVVASICLAIINTPIAIILFVTAFAFLSPLGMMKNYWIGNLFIAALILFFLEANSTPPSVFHLSILRSYAIGLGCVIGALSVYLWIHLIPEYLKQNQR
jgi:uncharacterized membrane protein YccC